MDRLEWDALVADVLGERLACVSAIAAATECSYYRWSDWREWWADSRESWREEIDAMTQAQYDALVQRISEL